MPLTFTVRSGETMLINGAELLFRDRADVIFLSRPSFVAGKQVMAEDAVTTPLRQIYFEMQHAYAGRGFGDAAAADRLLTDIGQDQRFDLGGYLGLVPELILRGEWHPALRLMRAAIRAETEEMAA